MAQSNERAAERADAPRFLTLGRALTRDALQVCDRLEALADALPRCLQSNWRDVQNMCRSTLTPLFLLLSDGVYPAMLNQPSADVDRIELFTRLAQDCTDRLHALTDLDDLIVDALDGGKFVREPEALGFALRGHFEALRRDLAWQRDVVWPLAARTLSPEGMSHVLATLRRSETIH